MNWRGGRARQVLRTCGDQLHPILRQLATSTSLVGSMRLDGLRQALRGMLDVFMVLVSPLRDYILETSATHA